MYKLVENEVLKMIIKKRLYISIGILLVMVCSFAYGYSHSMERTKTNLARRVGITSIANWRSIAQQQLIDMQNRLDSPYMDDEHRASMRVRMEQLKYNLDHNINPVDMTGPGFTSRFVEQSISLFLPLLIILLSADLVSGEFTGGTIKLLLVRGVPRWKILMSKYLALLILEVVVLFFSLIITYLVAGGFFGFGGWDAPIATGFKVVGGKLITSNVVNVPQWSYTFMAYGLAFFVSLTVGTVSFMISVLVRSTAASIGVILATLIGGSLLNSFLTDWQLPRYLFMANLRLTDYISGSLRPIEGMDMVFSLTVLSCWIIGALIVSFVRFEKQDVLV